MMEVTFRTFSADKDPATEMINVKEQIATYVEEGDILELIYFRP